MKHSLVHLGHQWFSISLLTGQTVPNGGRDRSQLTLCDSKTSASEPDPKPTEITGKMGIELMVFDSLSEMETNSNND